MTAAGPTRWERALPGVAVLRRYDRAWLRGDVLAGVTVAAYLVPQVLAYAEVAGLPAIAGLWAVGPGLLVYALLGSSRQLSVGPESTTALMTAAGVGALVTAAGGLVAREEAAAMLAIAVGVVCIVGWASRLGFLSELLSKPVLVGYMAGIAALMIVSQIGKVTGIQVEGESFLQELRYAVTHLGDVHVPTLVLSLAVLAVLLALQRWRPTWPAPLIGMLGATIVVQLTGLADSSGIKLVGPVPQGLPPISVPSFTDVDLWQLAPAALGVAIVGYSDNVLTARAFAGRHREQIDSNQEFLGLGVANIGAGLVQGFPISSSGSRTVIADTMGARTQLHSLVSLVLVIATLLWLGPVIAAFPLAALGAVVVYAALRLVDIAEMRRFAAFRRSELVLALSTTAAVLLFGVLPGIGAAIALSVLDLLRRIVHPHDGVLGYVPGIAGMHDIDDHPRSVQVPGLVVYRYDSPLFFANSDDFLTRARRAVEDAQADGPVEWFVLNAEAISEVDLTSIDALEELRRGLSDEGVVFAMARVKQDLRTSLEAGGVVDAVGVDLIFPTLPTAVVAYAAWYQREHGAPPPGLTIPPVPPTPAG
ncbi:SulP family sulfate permease [Humibacillus xanthopallidus]|uniref:SulP family sulfate permease n=1 Tax=Humibacillus xanthopallidus TaxID=412689 RepID=A0A543PL50_9MICO|nr:sulfate permease [Humibacillus xanthopallidus]TQN44802.1 SulP family sulfate permease [Humibacillus xanthopallidus]